MGSSRKALWSWLVVAVGCVVAACSREPVPSGSDGYEIVGTERNLITPDSQMTAIGCVRLPEGQGLKRAGSLMLAATGSGEVRRFDCGDVSWELVKTGIRNYAERLRNSPSYRAASYAWWGAGFFEGGEPNPPNGAPLPGHWSEPTYGMTCNLDDLIPNYHHLEYQFDEAGCFWWGGWDWIPEEYGSGGGGTAPSPVSIAITGPDTVYVGQSGIAFSGTVTYSDASTTPGSTWFTSNAAVLRYDGSATFMPLTAGTVRITDSVLGLNIKAYKDVVVMDPYSPLCLPTDPSCHVRIGGRDSIIIRFVIDSFIRSPSEISDTLARRECQETRTLIDSIMANNPWDQVFRGATSFPPGHPYAHDGAAVRNSKKMHVEPWLMDSVALPPGAHGFYNKTSDSTRYGGTQAKTASWRVAVELMHELRHSHRNATHPDNPPSYDPYPYFRSINSIDPAKACVRSSSWS